MKIWLVWGYEHQSSREWCSTNNPRNSHQLHANPRNIRHLQRPRRTSREPVLQARGDGQQRNSRMCSANDRRSTHRPHVNPCNNRPTAEPAPKLPAKFPALPCTGEREKYGIHACIAVVIPPGATLAAQRSREDWHRQGREAAKRTLDGIASRERRNRRKRG